MLDTYNDILSINELCEILDISKGSAYKLVSSNQLKCFRYNRVWKIPKAGIVEYIKTQSKLS